MKISELLEALKPSEYRGLVKGWDKGRYAKIFKRYASDRNAYRIYIPLKGEAAKIDAPSAIAKAIADAGYEVEDYATGIASKDGGKRKVKIGKILKDPELLKQFAEDPKRGGAKRSDYTVVISRHPYDVAGMSTDRGWTSCMNLTGINKEYIPADIEAGTLVAYLIKGDDKNISAPVARVLIKPFFSPSTDDIAFGIQDSVYGTNVPGFVRTVREWVDEVNDSNKLDGLFHWDDKLYDDSGFVKYNDGAPPESLAFGKTGEKMPKIIDAMYNVPLAKRGEFLETAGLSEKEMMELLRREPSIIRHIKNPTEKMTLVAVKSPYGYKNLLDDIDDPSDEVLRAAVKYNPDTIESIKDPSEELQLIAVKSNGGVLRSIKKPTEKVKFAAVQRSGEAIAFIKDPSEELQLVAINSEPSVIRLIKNPSHKAMWTAVKKSMSTFLMMMHAGFDMPEDLLIYVAKNRPGYIGLMKKSPSPAVLAAAKEAEDAFNGDFKK